MSKISSYERLGPKATNAPSYHWKIITGMTKNINIRRKQIIVWLENWEQNQSFIF